MPRIEINHRTAGLVTATYTDDWATGSTVYDVRAERVTGALTITTDPPYPTKGEPIDPWTPDILAAPGIEHPHWRGWHDHRTDPLTVNGVPLCGPGRVDITVLGVQPLRSWGIHVRRLLAEGHSTSEVPALTRKRYAAIVEALVLHWATRPDIAALRMAAARHAAAPYIERQREAAAKARKESAEALTRARAAEQRADQAAALLTLTTPDQQQPEQEPGAA